MVEKKRKRETRPGPFDEGDSLAPFRWAVDWKIGQRSVADVPVWVLEHFLDLAVRYWFKRRAALREGRRPLTLDELTGLSGTKSTAWTAEARAETAALVRHAFDRCVERARRERERVKSARPPPKRPWTAVQTTLREKGPVVDVIDKRGRPTREFQVDLGRLFEVCPSASRAGKSADEAVYRELRRLLKEAAGPGDVDI
jgi:hypothetical protein